MCNTTGVETSDSVETIVTLRHLELDPPLVTSEERTLYPLPQKTPLDLEVL